jgi:putative ABC transport system permease protein
VGAVVLRVGFKSLLERKLRLLMSTFAIVLGVGFVAGTLVFSDTLDRSFTSIFASSVGDVVVRPEGGRAGDGSPSTITIPAALVDELAEVEGAARADGRVEAFGVFVIDKDGKPIGGSGPPAFGAGWSDAPAGHGIKGLVIDTGREPQGPGEVVLDEFTAEKSGYELGDQVKISTVFRQASLDPVLVGTARFAEGGSLNGATLAAFETRAAQDLFLDGKDAYSEIWVTAEDGVSQGELRDEVAQELPVGFEAVTGDDASDEQATDLLDDLSFITTTLLIFAAIALIVGSYLIVNTFSILVAQRSRELALLRALGASQWQVRRLVLAEAGVLGLLGSTLGLGLGILLFFGIRLAFAQFGLDLANTPMVFGPRTVLAAYAVGVVVTVAAAFVPAWLTSRVSPVQAMRDDIALPEATLRRRSLVGAGMVVVGAVGIGLALFGDVPRAGYVLGLGALLVLLGVTALSALLAGPFLRAARSLYGRWFGMVGTLAGQNALRNPRRTAATASALMIGLALCTTMAILGSSAKKSVDEAVEENFVGDYVVSNVFGVPFSPVVAEQTAEIPGVSSVNRFRFQYLDGDFNRPMVAVDPAEVTKGLKISMSEGSLEDLTEGTVIVSEKRAEDDGLEVGDEVEIDVPTKQDDYELVGVFEANQVLGDGYVVSLDTFTAAGFQPSDNYVFVSVDEGARAEVLAALKALTKDMPLVTVKDQAGLAEEQRGPIDQLLALIYGLLALALVIAVLGIVNTLALSIIERTREVGLLRALGVSRRQLRTMIRLESVVIAVLGALMGTLLGVVFGVVLMKDLESQGLRVISVPLGQLLAFLAISVVVGVLAAVVPARRAARLDVLRAIATE